MMATHFTFIRHGETDWNVQQRFQGQLDVPLNATGHAQAQRLAARLADDVPDVLVSSDLERARQTAAPLAAAWGLEPMLAPGLREQGFGVLEGLDGDEARAQHPALWARWLEHRTDDAPPGGESLRQFSARVLEAVRALAASHAGQRLVVVSHGGVLDMLWRHAKALPLDGMRACPIPNTGINRLRWVDAGLHIDSWGDDAHLADMPPSAAAMTAR